MMIDIVAATVAIACLLAGIFIGWGVGVALLAMLHVPSPMAVFGPILAFLFCSARWKHRREPKSQ
jgi:uncharacterized membrane protein